MRPHPSSLILVALISVNIPVAQAHWDYYASLTGSAMVPPTPSAGEGYFQAKFPGHTPCPSESDELQIQTWYVDHLEGSPTAISFWVGADGENGELFERLPIGTWSVTFSAAQCEELYNENMYIVLETDLYPEGELRGDILMAKSAPVEAHSWGAIKHRYH